ncbi:MAG TPA: hypothetical protein VJ756_15595 [Terriglobales bacterium]|nr:hypothetical protein [Terriglobales bacterium]
MNGLYLNYNMRLRSFWLLAPGFYLLANVMITTVTGRAKEPALLEFEQ